MSLKEQPISPINEFIIIKKRFDILNEKSYGIGEIVA